MMGRWLIQAGALLLICGLVLLIFERFGVPKLPGDVIVRKKGWSFYAPFGTSIVVSIAATLLLNFLSRR